VRRTQARRPAARHRQDRHSAADPRQAGTLDPAELARIREHPALGAKILEPLAAFAEAIPIVRSHHERFDGGGYPQRLAGEEIPLLARLLAVADVYDALVSSRPYRPGWNHEEALATIRAGSGTHFDPRMVEAFFDVMEQEGDAARFSLSTERLS
jgi:HD-GYP domain-containing protein (c-di-GMP phosphodiesterase class II)